MFSHKFFWVLVNEGMELIVTCQEWFLASLSKELMSSWLSFLQVFTTTTNTRSVEQVL